MRRPEQERGGNQKEGVREALEAFITALLTFPLPHSRVGGSDYNVIPFILPNTPGVYYWGIIGYNLTITLSHYYTFTQIHNHINALSQ